VPSYCCAVAEIQLVEGDITEQQVDVIVNAANSSLLGGGGVDGAIHRRGGPEILAECKALRAERFPDGLPTGEAVATTAGRLPARWVVHTVGPVYSRQYDRSELLAACHRNALRCAAELGAETIAFPAISTGVYRWPLESAAEIAIGTTTAALSEHPSIRLVRFVLWGQDAWAAFRAASGRV
jgi:O-acetyl-ADP-ribose deacetylase